MKRLFILIQSMFYVLPQAVSVFLGKRETTRFPDTPAEITPGYRGVVRIREANCVGCGLCTRDCPANALEIKRISKGIFKLLYFADRCAFCGQCELSCRFDAIYLDNLYLEASEKKKSFQVMLVDRKTPSDGSIAKKKPGVNEP